MRRVTRVAAATVTVLWMAWYSLAAGPNAATAKAAAPKSGPQVTVLDHYFPWRIYQTMKPPVIQMDDGLKPVILPPSSDWANHDTAAAPADWAKPDFAAVSWLRSPAGGYAHCPYLARLCLLSHFEVADPAQVEDLRLTLGYVGGAIIYVNGVEVARGHVAKAGAEQSAEGYPAEAFTAKPPAALERVLADVAIPAKLLKKGGNTLGIEILRAPYHKIFEERKVDITKKEFKDRGCPYDLNCNLCDLTQLKLTAGSGDGVTSITMRPKEMQAWNASVLTYDYDSDMADRLEPLRPVVIKGARNGWYSAKMCVGSPKAIAGLKATVSELKLGGATIAASELRVRYSANWPGGPGDWSYTVPYASMIPDALLESPLDSFAAGKYGAVVPIWVTLKIPADAKVGTYSGEMTVVAKGEKTIVVPLKLEVADFTLPNQDDWRTWVELIQSPDSLAMEYNVPLWSDKHWALMEESMRYLGEMGSRTTYIPLIAQTNFGNAESMVRWIKKADGSYDYDFSSMDKYLDLVQKRIGKLKIVCFPVWEVYLATPAKEVKATEKDAGSETVWQAARWDLRGKGPAVTGLDPASGQTATVYLPRWEDPAAKAAWKPLFQELHKRMAKRGLEEKMMLGMASDIWPSQPEVAAIQEVSGDLPWVSHTHGGSHAAKLYNARLTYIAWVWDNIGCPDPATGKHLYGWKNPELVTQYKRFGHFNDWPLASLMHVEEANITGGQRGLGRIGADFWTCLRNAKGERKGRVFDRYPQSLWHSLNLSNHLLVPGPTGPVATPRYEAFREGVQLCEARIAIERVLTDEALKAKLGPELAKQCQDVLDERIREDFRAGSEMGLSGRYFITGATLWDLFDGGGWAGQRWFAGSGWQDREQKFYTLAGEVVKKTGAK